MNKKRYVLDSYAVLSLLFGEAASVEVMAILSGAEKGKNEVFIHWNNLAEIYYIIRKQESQKRALDAISLVKALPIQFIEFDEMLWLKAAELKGTHPISFCDAFAAATADVTDAIIVTGDPEFKKLQDQFSIHWLTKKKK